MRALWPILSLLLLGVAACTERRNRSEELGPDVKLREVTLTFPETGVADIVLPVPPAFQPMMVSEPGKGVDAWLLGDPADGESSTKPVRGQIYLRVRPRGQTLLADSASKSTVVSTVAGQRVFWRETAEEDNDGTMILQREFVEEEVLAQFNRSRAPTNPLTMQVIVSGTSGRYLDTLIGCVERMRILPVRGNL